MDRLGKGTGLCVNWDPGALFEPDVLLFANNKLLFKLLIELPNSDEVDDDSLTSLQPFFKKIIII